MNEKERKRLKALVQVQEPAMPSVPIPTTEQEIFTIEEAARYLRVGRPAIDEAIRARRLKVIQLGDSRRNLRIYKQDLLAIRGFVR